MMRIRLVMATSLARLRRNGDGSGIHSLLIFGPQRLTSLWATRADIRPWFQDVFVGCVKRFHSGLNLGPLANACAFRERVAR